MKILPRYVVKEHLGPFLFAMLAINLTFILNLLFRDLGKFLSKGLSLSVILEFLFLNLAWMIALSVPMAVLTATLMAFGRLAADNEITAMRAGGVSLYQILPHVLLVAAVVGGALVWFNNSVLPNFNHRARLLAMDIARKKPMINLDSGVFYTDIPHYSILVEKVQDRDSLSLVENVTIYDQTNANEIKTIVARQGRIHVDQHTGLLEIALTDGEAQSVNIVNLNEFQRVQFPRMVIRIPVTEMILTRRNSGYRGDREKSAAQLMADVQNNRKKIAERRQDIREKLDKLWSRYIGQATRPTLKQILADHKRTLALIKADANMIRSFQRTNDMFLVEVHKKYAIPTACVVFILIGAPLGIIVRKGGMLLSAGLSLGFFLLYWICLIGGESLADRQIISPQTAMWAPNVLVGIAGLYLVARMGRVR